MEKSSRNFLTVTRVGLDLAKRVFQVHAVGAKEEIVVARKLTRSQLIPFFAELAPCVGWQWRRAPRRIIGGGR
jgi:transposase